MIQPAPSPRRIRRLCTTLGVGIWLSAALTAATWQTEIKPRPKDNFTKAAFSLWLDGTAPPPCALLVITPGWNGDGRGAVNDAQWKAFAREQHLGLIGVFFQSDERDETAPPYHVPAYGSGAALLQAIDQFAHNAQKPALSRAPLLLWGHSAGGQFGYGMACLVPERVLAFASIKGGVYLSIPTAGTLNVPGLFIVGEQDEAFRAINITRVFETGRTQNAPWCLAFEPNSGHEIGRSNDLIRPFFSGVLARRTPNGGPQLQTASIAASWTGIRSSLEIKKIDTRDKTETLRTVWLPDERAATAWATFSGSLSP